MKNPILLAVTVLVLMISNACSDNSVAEQEVVEPMMDSVTALTTEVVETSLPDLSMNAEALPTDYIEVDLSEFGFDGSISAPADAMVSKNTLFTQDGQQEEIMVKFDAQGIELHLFKSEKVLEEAKSAIEENTIDVFQSWMHTDLNSVVYFAQKNVNDAAAYNFLKVTESNGQLWHAKGEGHGSSPLSKKQALLLYAMAQTLDQ